MRWRPITRWVLIIIPAFLIVYDVFPFLDPARGDTISEMTMFYAFRLFTVPFTFGTLCGHFFWPREGHHPQPKILLPVAAFSIGLDVVTRVFNIHFLEVAQTYPIFWCLIGIPFGHFFWPQQRSDKLPNLDK